jgi:hypothetical protein
VSLDIRKCITVGGNDWDMAVYPREHSIYIGFPDGTGVELDLGACRLSDHPIPSDVLREVRGFVGRVAFQQKEDLDWC